MNAFPILYTHSSPVLASATSSRKQMGPSNGDGPARKPDWLVIMVSVLFLLTLLIVWVIDMPAH